MAKYFTLREANEALKLVRPVTQDLLTKLAKAKELHLEVKSAKEQPQTNEILLLEKLREAERLLKDVEYHLKELEGIGVQLKDLALGLVDFPALLDGRIVCLCWKFGEQEIAAWHEVNAGYADRKPVDITSTSIS